MTKFIVHPGTATILNAAECVILDLDELDEQTQAQAWVCLEEGFDMELADIADHHGVPADSAGLEN